MKCADITVKNLINTEMDYRNRTEKRLLALESEIIQLKGLIKRPEGLECWCKPDVNYTCGACLNL